MRISINWASSNSRNVPANVHACDEALAGKPYSGNLSLRFDEGSGLNHPLLLYCKIIEEFCPAPLRD